MRKLALALALIAAALSAADYLGWRAEQHRLRALAAEAAPAGRLARLVAGLERETVPARGAARLAWRLLRLELDNQWLAELPEDQRPAERRRGLDRLRLARQLASDALARQPASWRAAAVIGATRYLEAARRGRRDQPAGAWAAPLEAAMRLAPGSPDPPLILASFYLSRWSSLAPAERAELPSVLSRAFAEPRGLRRLLPAWVRLAPSLGALLQPVPDTPNAWRELGRLFLAQGDLERFAMSHQRRVESRVADLADRADRGRARLRGGHARAGLGLLRSVVAAPPDLYWADSFAAALAELPDDALTGDSRGHVDTWLAWARELCAVGRCPFEQGLLARLARLAGEPASAAALTPEARESWPADLWRRRGETYLLALRPARPAQRIRLELAGVPATGAAIELAWDGRFAGVATVEPGEALVWPLAVDREAHLLQLRHLSGRPLRPGELTLGPHRRPG